MKIKPLEIPDVLLLELEVYSDERGLFMETYQSLKFAELGIPDPFVQDNHSGSRWGVLRGLHYQIRHAQGKLVRAIVGEIFDVCVDLRRSSPTFGKWVGMTLAAVDNKQIWIPKGFAHGFFVLSEWAEVLYKVTEFYAPEWERTLLWNDPELGIEWPLEPGQVPIQSERDRSGKPIADAEVYDWM
ncbi:MAG: dTDP-4-dehydrorhamnose 3,5-epimerase [Chloroflexi bacterium RBG_16_48_8]|nr:MAG: dTDP-4-dehydrorhamnose 3,5-epimerase [Chloroflexi bacterium RBG_16_48_8]